MLFPFSNGMDNGAFANFSGLNDLFRLDAAVSERGKLRIRDVARIETLLGKTGHLDLGTTDGPTGFFGQRLKQAIQGFQKDNGLKIDGVVNPDGETMVALQALVPSVARPAPDKPRSLLDMLAGQARGRGPTIDLAAQLKARGKPVEKPRVGGFTLLDSESSPAFESAAGSFKTAAAQAPSTGTPIPPTGKAASPTPAPSPIPTAAKGPQFNVSKQFADEIGARESGGNYSKTITNSRGEKVRGRYQLTEDALKQVNVLDKNGQWTGRFGINNEKDFEKNTAAQNKAFAAYLEENHRMLAVNGARKHVG